MIRQLAHPHVLKITPYQPGKPIEEVAREFGVEDVEAIIKLASNENPLGPSPKALAACASSLRRLHLYPDGSGHSLKEGLSRRLGVPPEMIILGNGSNEIIELIMHVFVGREHSVLYAHPSFPIYRLMALMFGSRAIEVPCREFTHDLDAMVKAIEPDTRVVFIANPNNPTGTAVRPEAIGDFLRRVSPQVVVVLDEAYYEYLPPDLRFEGIPHLQEKKLILLRTFSKIYGLAGLRIGYGLASAEMVEILNRVRQPFNTSSIAQAGALAALDDEAHVRRAIEVNRLGRARLEKGFQALGLEYVPSAANFILVRVGRGREVYNSLLARGIIVRPMDGNGLPEWLRITIGLPKENEKLLQELGKLAAPAEG
jgi:histidinol-phosphate aminotransferase